MNKISDRLKFIFSHLPNCNYFADIGLRNAILDMRQQEETHIMENIIYNELIVRGYRVDVGMVEIKTLNKEGKWLRSQLEVDFIASLGSKKYYIQTHTCSRPKHL